MPLNLAALPDSAALLAALANIDTAVRPCTRGRTTDQTEVFTGSHLLSALSQTNRLAFPLAVEHRDRPDIRLHMAGETVGVEVTEAVSKPWAEIMALAEQENRGALLELSHFGFDAPSRTLVEKRDLLHQPYLTSEGWVGDKPERDWAYFIHEVVIKKGAKCRSG